jgi:hypothetical protein
MSTLEVLGVLDRCPAFNKESFSVERMAKMNISPGDDVHGFYPHRREIKELALKRGREDIANAIDRSLTRSMRHARLMKLSRSYSKWPFVSRVMKALAIRVFGGVNSRKRNPRPAFAGQRK